MEIISASIWRNIHHDIYYIIWANIGDNIDGYTKAKAYSIKLVILTNIRPVSARDHLQLYETYKK